MLKIYKRSSSGFDSAVSIRPTPFVSISHTPQKNQVGSVGCTYNITLTGTIIAHMGSPTFMGGSATFTDDPQQQNVETGDLLKSIILKQNKLRELFAQDGNKIEIEPLSDNPSGNKIIIVPNFVSIDFEDGLYVDTCRYTVNLESSMIFDQGGNVYTEALMASTFSPNQHDNNRDYNEYLRETSSSSRKNITTIINRWGGIVEDFSDTWSIETDESNSQTSTDNVVPKTYIVNRNMSATGKMFYDTIGKKHEAWEQAVGFVKKTLLFEPQAPPTGDDPTLQDNERYALYPAKLSSTKYSDKFLNLPSFYRGYNHVRTLNIDKTAGSCSVSETWILASGQSHLENYTINLSSSADDGSINLKIDGNITGLSDIHASGYNGTSIGQFDSSENNSPYAKAINKYREISNNGNFGVGSELYLRANRLISDNPNINLNPQPLSLSLASNENNGTLTYNIEFDNRPPHIFSAGNLVATVSEVINVVDNYPGDLYAVIPVLGRQTGPILQYIQGRTEYSRNVDIELILDYAVLSNPTGTPFIVGLPPSSIYTTRQNLSLNKPSLDNSSPFFFRSKLENLVTQLSPSGEPFVTYWYLKPPAETWNPKEGRYSLNLSWDYQKSR